MEIGGVKMWGGDGGGLSPNSLYTLSDATLGHLWARKGHKFGPHNIPVVGLKSGDPLNVCLEPMLISRDKGRHINPPKRCQQLIIFTLAAVVAAAAAAFAMVKWI